MKSFFRQLEMKMWELMRSYMPRWTIYLIDIFIVFLAFVSLWFFRDSISGKPAEYFQLKLFVSLFFYTFCSIIFKTYHGVIRYSTMKDLKMLSISALCAMSLYILAGTFANFLQETKGYTIHFNLLFPFVQGLMVIAGQLILRFIVKSVFETFERRYQEQKIKVFILGGDYESVLLANSMLNERNNPYQPVAFITFNDSQSRKTVGGLPILSAKKGMLNHMYHYKAHTLLLYKSQLDSMPKEFYDNCIVEGLELLMVTMLSRFDENTERIEPQINKIKIEDLLGRNAIIMDKDAVEEQFNGKTILITGAAGSIGSEIAIQVSRFKCKTLIILDQAETPLNDLWLALDKKNPNNIDIKPIIGSVSNETKMRQIFDLGRPDIIFHAAAYKHVPMMESHPSASVVTNVLGTKIVADLAVEFGAQRFVMISTDKAVNPTNVMGATKRAAEIYIQSLFYKQLEDSIENPTQFVTTRFGNVLGSNGSVVPLFKRQIEEGGPITITHKDITRYFMTIPEACSLVLEAGCTGNGGEIYVFDMGEAIKIYDLAEKMIRLSGKIPGQDIKIVETGLRPGEKLYEELLAPEENTLPTYHKKVRIAKVRKHKFSSIAPIIEEMTGTALQCVYPVEVVKQLKVLIPEFISKNSEKFELLDNMELEKKELEYLDK